MKRKEGCLSLNKVFINKVIVILSIIIVLAGLFVILKPYLQEKRDLAYNSIVSEVYDREVLDNLSNMEELSEEQPADNDEYTEQPDVDVDTEEPQKKPETQKPQNNYIGMIQINKINLNRGFVDPTSKYNDIKYNVTIIKGSNFPDVKNGNFILAAHSGSGPLAIFKNLYKLKVGDTVDIIYKNKKYTYKIVKIYYQKKQGYIAIYRDVNKTTLTLVTCTKDNSKSQTVYIAELI